MKDFEVIQSADRIRALARDQRLEILRHLVAEPLTATMVAEQLGRPANQIHYHIGQLVEQALVEEVMDARPPKKGERFYRAVARQFLVDPGLTGPDESVSNSVLQSLEVSALHQRRKAVLDLDLHRIASSVVSRCLRVKREERVLVIFAPPALELAETILTELHAVGAEARIKIWSRNVIFGTLDRHTPESLESLPFLHPNQDRDLDAMIMLTSSVSQGAPPDVGQREKLPFLMEALSTWQRSLRERNVRTVEISLPNRKEFEGGSASVEDAIDTYWKCLDADTTTLRSTGSNLRKRFVREDRWRISDSRGTDLEFDVAPATIHVSDGVIDEEDIAVGMPDEVLPAGQLRCIPVAESADGSIWADYTFLAGRHFYDVHLTIRSGRIVDVQTREDAAALLSILRRESGDPDLLSTVGIGLNPAGRVLTGRPSLDATLAGVVTIGFGNNELDGGSVRSTLNLNLPARSMTVTVGESVLVAGGVLTS